MNKDESSTNVRPMHHDSSLIVGSSTVTISTLYHEGFSNFMLFFEQIISY